MKRNKDKQWKGTKINSEKEQLYFVCTQNISFYQVQQYAFKTNSYKILEDEKSTGYSFPMHTKGIQHHIGSFKALIFGTNKTNVKRMNHLWKL